MGKLRINSVLEGQTPFHVNTAVTIPNML